MAHNDLDGQRWVGYELHDGLLQWMVGARMQLEMVISRDPNSSQTQEIQRALRYTELAIEEGRSLIGFIEGGTLQEPREFRELMEQFLESVRVLAVQQGQELELAMGTSVWPSLSPPVLWNVFRIAEQAVRNAMKHAGRAHIRVLAEQSDQERLRLIVQDDGVGISDPPPSKPDYGHFGMSSMRHRAALIGGQLEVARREPAGTQVTLLFSPTWSDEESRVN